MRCGWLLSVCLLSVALSGGCAHTTVLHRDPRPALSTLPEDTRQAVVVIPARAPKFAARVSLWEHTADGWTKVKGPLPAVVGRNGIAARDAKREGDGRTPSGTFALKRAFGYADKMDTGLVYEPAGSEDIWIDDPASPLYNRRVSGSLRTSSHEKLRRDDALYEYAAVIEYNTDPIVRGAGSAIFLHVWRDKNTATAGCVALKSTDVQSILRWLDVFHNPVIILQSHEDS